MKIYILSVFVPSLASYETCCFSFDVSDVILQTSCIHTSELTCHCEFLGLTGHLFALDVDRTLIFSTVGDSGLRQWVKKIFRGAGCLGIDGAAVLVYSVLTAQHLLPRAADDGLTSQSHIGTPSHISIGFNGQGNISNCEC